MSRLVMLTVLCLLAACVSAAQPTSLEEKQDNSDLQVEGRGIRDRMRSVWDFFFGEGDDEDYDDYGGNQLGSDVSSYTWYDPSSARRETNVVSDDEDEYSWGEYAFGAALAIVPLGLLLAAFPAGLFTVAVKKRSFSDDSILNMIDPTELPLLKSVQEGDLLALIRPECQQKLFCEISQLGKTDSATFIQRTFYYISNLVPENLSRRLRLQRMFEASRQNACQRFTCHSSSASASESPSNHLVVPVNSKDKA